MENVFLMLIYFIGILSVLALSAFLVEGYEKHGIIYIKRFIAYSCIIALIIGYVIYKFN